MQLFGLRACGVHWKISTGKTRRTKLYCKCNSVQSCDICICISIEIDVFSIGFAEIRVKKLSFESNEKADFFGERSMWKRIQFIRVECENDKNNNRATAIKQYWLFRPIKMKIRAHTNINMIFKHTRSHTQWLEFIGNDHWGKNPTQQQKSIQ